MLILSLHGHLMLILSLHGHLMLILSLHGHLMPILSLHGHLMLILSLHGHLMLILSLHGHLMPILSLHGHLMLILSLHGHIKSAPHLQTGTLLSLPHVTFSINSKALFNPETEQFFCLVNNQLILTLILYVLDSHTPVIRMNPTHPI